MRCSSAAAALLALLLVEQGDAAKRRPAKSAGCTVTSVWPDGTTLDRRVHIPARHAPPPAFLVQPPPISPCSVRRVPSLPYPQGMSRPGRQLAPTVLQRQRYHLGRVPLAAEHALELASPKSAPCPPPPPRCETPRVPPLTTRAVSVSPQERLARRRLRCERRLPSACGGV